MKGIIKVAVKPQDKKKNEKLENFLRERHYFVKSWYNGKNREIIYKLQSNYDFTPDDLSRMAGVRGNITIPIMNVAQEELMRYKLLRDKMQVKNLYFTRDKETEITFFNYQLGTAAETKESEAAQELLIELEHLFDIGDKEKIQIYERVQGEYLRRNDALLDWSSMEELEKEEAMRETITTMSVEQLTKGFKKMNSEVYDYKVFFLDPINSSNAQVEKLMIMLEDGYEIYNTTVVYSTITYILRKAK
jgi:hypothetical protein